MIFFKAFLLIISLIAIPCIPGFLGMQFFHVKEEQAFSRFLWAWLLGTLFSWALFQLVSVPLNFMRQKLSLAILLWLSLLILLSLFFFFSNKSNKKESCLQDSPRASGMRSISFLTASCASLARSAFLCNREFRRNFLLHKKGVCFPKALVFYGVLRKTYSFYFFLIGRGLLARAKSWLL